MQQHIISLNMIQKNTLQAALLLALMGFAFGCAQTRPVTEQAAQTAPPPPDQTTRQPTNEVPAQGLNDSPRHHEWVAVPQGDRQVQSYIAYPETDKKATAVIVIHENRGLTDWERNVADQLAAAGYLAIAPDLLSGAGPDGGRTSDFASSDAAREAIYQLPPQQVTADLHAVYEFVSRLPAANGKVAVVGFCWGGSQAFRMATTHPNLAAAFVFYGTGPDSKDAISQIRAPVFGFYGGNDARVNATIPKSEELTKEAGKVYQPVIYEGAGHAYMRAGAQPDASPANKAAREESWERLLTLLGQL
jgi:carboxymethylenebutenolidase